MSDIGVNWPALSVGLFLIILMIKAFKDKVDRDFEALKYKEITTVGDPMIYLKGHYKAEDLEEIIKELR